MLDLHTLAEFSRTNCVAICAFLVPANIIATLVTMGFAAFNRPWYQLWQASGLAFVFALVMLLHVYTWFSIGVVMAATYVLLSLAVSCLFANLGAILFHRRYEELGVRS